MALSDWQPEGKHGRDPTDHWQQRSRLENKIPGIRNHDNTDVAMIMGIKLNLNAQAPRTSVMISCWGHVYPSHARQVTGTSSSAHGPGSANAREDGLGAASGISGGACLLQGTGRPGDHTRADEPGPGPERFDRQVLDYITIY